MLASVGWPLASKPRRTTVRTWESCSAARLSQRPRSSMRCGRCLGARAATNSETQAWARHGLEHRHRSRRFHRRLQRGDSASIPRRATACSCSAPDSIAVLRPRSSLNIGLALSANSRRLDAGLLSSGGGLDARQRHLALLAACQILAAPPAAPDSRRSRPGRRRQQQRQREHLTPRHRCTARADACSQVGRRRSRPRRASSAQQGAA